MSKYLNGEGLSHLMTKIKSWAADTFASKSHTHDYTKTRVKGNAESSYRTGDVNLTPDNIGAVAKSAELLTTNPFRPNSMAGPYISKIDNAFYAADKRWDISAVVDGTTALSASDIAWFFNGDYESRYQLAKGKTCVITFDFSNTTYFPGYPYGYILVSFYNNEAPASVSGRVYCNYSTQGVGWHDITFTKVSDGSAYQNVYRSSHQGYYNISQLEITIVAGSSIVAGISQIEMHLDRPYSGRNPFLSKYVPETLYYNLTAPKFIGDVAGDVTGDVTGGIKPASTRPTNANTTGYSARLNYFLASDFMTTNKPSSGNGHILDMEWDDNGKWHGQVAVPAFSPGHIEWRTENGGTWTTWRKLFDDRDVIPAANGGTGQTSLVNSANALINALSTGSSDPGDNDYYVSQYVNGGTTTTTFHRRPMSALWNYIKGKISSILGLTDAQYGGNAATATSAGNVTGTVAIANGGTGKTTAAEAWTALGGGAIGKKSTLAESDIPSLAISKVTNLQTSLDNKAPLASPAFTGTPTAPTAATGTNTTQVATTAFVKDAMDNLTVYSEDIEYGTGTVAEALDEISQTVHNLPTKAFTKVNVGTTTIVADSADDALTLAAGTNVTLTPNAANDSITISVANATGYSLDNDIIGRATDYGPLYFSEDAGDAVVVDGPLPVEYGGTGVATIAALKTALGLGDSGWQTLPLGSAFKAYGTSYTPMYRKVNGVVEVTGGVSPNTAQTLGETALTIGTLPMGFRPASNRNVQVICQGSGRKLWLMRIDSSGVVSAQRMRDMGSTSYQSMATNEWMLFSATFLAG